MKEKKINEELSHISNIIGQETVLEGSMGSTGNIRLEGKIYGNVTAKAKFVMGKEACIEGNVVARSGEIAGNIKGNIEISELLILKPSAVVNGDILANRLVVEPGATFNGSCKMGHLSKEIEISLPKSHVAEKTAKRV